MPNPRHLDTTITRCVACPFAAFWAEGAFSKEYSLNGRRIYVGCSKAKRSFDYLTNPYEPGDIPEWCPLPAPALTPDPAEKG